MPQDGFYFLYFTEEISLGFSHTNPSVILRVRSNWKHLSFPSSDVDSAPATGGLAAWWLRRDQLHTLFRFSKMEVTLRFAWSYHKDNSCSLRKILTVLKSKKDFASSRWSINTSCVNEEMMNKRTNGWRDTGNLTFEKCIITASLSYFFSSLTCFKFQSGSVMVKHEEKSCFWTIRWESQRVILWGTVLLTNTQI